MWAMIAVSIAMAIWTALLVWMHVRTEKRREMQGTTTTALAEKERGLVHELPTERPEEKAWA
jgi:ACS family pantothenate transporter-like MFS transporter